MSSQRDILRKALKIAVKNGYKLPAGHVPDTLIEEAVQPYNANLTFIYSHDFAKVLWGEGQTATTNQRRDLHIGMTGWQHHLQQMVVSADPLKYLEQNI